MTIELNDGGWEYAPMFNMKFHADERSLDMTRRRRWHRKMVPDTSLLDSNLPNATSVTMVANTDIIFRMQTRITSAQGNQQQAVSPAPKSKDIKIELTAPRMYLSFKSERPKRHYSTVIDT